jgi:hypothetical protein
VFSVRLASFVGKQVILGLNVQEVQILAEDTCGRENTMRGIVRSTFSRAGQERVEIRSGNALLQFLVGYSKRPQLGDRIVLRLPDEVIYFFDPQNEAKI